MNCSDVGTPIDPESSIPTRRSLLSRLKNWEDQESWQQFFDTYWRLIYCVAIKSGLSEDEAQEVVQETVLTVAKRIDAFVYDPKVCSFKTWLKQVTRLRILDQVRKRDPNLTPRRIRQDPATHTPTVERVPDPQGVKLEQVWDEEWEQNLLEVAIRRVKHRVRPQHYQVFFLSSLQQKAPREVARMLGMNIGQVYLVRHRVSRLVRRELELLESHGR